MLIIYDTYFLLQPLFHPLWILFFSFVFYYVDLHPVKNEETGMEGIYWGVDYPWPMSDRDVSSTSLPTTLI